MSLTIDLAGRKALVTGASRGIGREIALALAGSGADVACLATNAALLDEVCRQVPAGAGHGPAEAATAAKAGKALPFPCDLADPRQIEEAVPRAAEALGGLDILVNNAGIARDNLLMRLREEDWDRVVDVNLKAAFLTMKAASRYLLRSKAGRIINISSVAGLIGNPGQANYAASKAGLIGLTKSAAREFASRGICVNAVAPGFIRTEMASQMDTKVLDAAIRQIPFQRMGEPREVADVVLFLASDLARYITGQVLVVDGGMAM